MKKILLVVALVVGLCLLATVGNCAPVGWTDKDPITFTGNTGFARLEVQKKVFHFKNIQPGERLGVTWWIHNTGLCPLIVTVDVRVTGDPASYLFAVFYPKYTLHMGPGLAKNVALTVRMDKNAPDKTANKNFWVTVTFNSKEEGNKWEYPGYDTW